LSASKDRSFGWFRINPSAGFRINFLIHKKRAYLIKRDRPFFDKLAYSRGRVKYHLCSISQLSECKKLIF